MTAPLPNRVRVSLRREAFALDVDLELPSRGITVIQNRCPKIEYQRLFGELRMGGFATGLISSRL